MSSECTNSAISSASSSSRSGLISSLVSIENDRDVNHSRKSKKIPNPEKNL
ncbi:Uncharacterized protein APZ42_000582 [Daphnia magna]|uniref:Uncharacterized protein n=1 Tax=Daphnia magna TaxID=35525 RepID=A0A164JIV8_9CRUS|nr:Uncharacterized protein APZ42_000582 [Daphnia magna]